MFVQLVGSPERMHGDPALSFLWRQCCYFLDKRSGDGTPAANFKADDIEAKWPYFMPPVSRRY